MEVKEQRADGGDTHEIYSMLVEPDELMRTQRRLRREICVSRIVLIVLLGTCMALCGAFYILQVHGSKNIEIPNKEKANETLVERQTGDRDEKVDVQTPHVAVAYLKPQSYAENAARETLKWTGTPVGLGGFNFTDSDESLTIPRSGKYRIGLQITYTGRQEGQINLNHNIIKISSCYHNNEPIPILSVYETVYGTNYWFKSVFSEIIHVFCKDDKIKVEVDKASFLDIAGQLNTKSFLTVQFISGL
ncbi:putative tumor necrosis factor ligand superfamily member 15-like [Clarias magur]|uniref:Putative tumor necrosis factor ligand superfamily member 15-like n=1 Tax=Clarias magur TaxID=1594786 RepID=A0A8J4U535_CLAMG|nr:putative tumor necrosis factor ligand superfamily member 15-like [Clarias magur]